MTKKYELTDEHRAQLKPWAEKWIRIAMSTEAMTEADRDAMRVAIKGLYEAADLKPPPPERIVFVPSPLVGNVASGFAAAIWWLRRNAKSETHDATEAATRAATESWAVSLSVRIAGPNSKFLISCAQAASRLWNGGNHWAGWPAVISFFRHVAKLPIDFSKWQHYEATAIHGSWRWMHPDFCIVSDRPMTLKVDNQNRPHSADGPSHEWRDGWKLYHWRGVAVPARWIERRDALTSAEVFAEQNAERRRAGCEILGWDRVLHGVDAKLVDADGDPQIGTLYEGQIPGAKKCGFLKVECGTGREFVIPVPPGMPSAIAAQAWIQNVPASKWIKPEARG